MQLLYFECKHFILNVIILKWTQNKRYKPQIIDTGEHFVQSNLPQLWILMCDNLQHLFTIPYLTYGIINHTELCILNVGILF